ncbi:hypothetical protein ACF0H5_014279 [Mactra antiquata]
MKRIKCWKCTALIKPEDITPHLRNCSGKQENKPRAEEKSRCYESPAKRQKVSTTCIEKEELTSRNDENDTTCTKCTKGFSTKSNCLRHEALCSGAKVKKTDITSCGKCSKSFSDYRNKLRHEKKCGTTKKCKTANFQCTKCKTQFQTVRELLRHERESSHNQPGSSGEKEASPHRNKNSNNNNRNNNNNNSNNKTEQKPLCKLCGERFESNKERYIHRMTVHEQSVSIRTREDPWSARGQMPPWINEDGSENESLRCVYDQHRHLILRDSVQEGQVTTTYNLPVSNLSNVNQLMDQVDTIFLNSQTSFKINLSFGLILQNIVNHNYRYFSPHFTDGLFLFPQAINNREDVERLRSRLAALDLSSYFQKQKPNSKWKPVAITNVLFVVYKTSFPLGLSQPLPAYIKNSKSIVSFEKNPRSGQMYTDNLCFFRCLAFHKSKNIKCERLTHGLHQKWIQYAHDKKNQIHSHIS